MRKCMCMCKCKCMCIVKVQYEKKFPVQGGQFAGGCTEKQLGLYQIPFHQSSVFYWTFSANISIRMIV